VTAMIDSTLSAGRWRVGSWLNMQMLLCLAFALCSLRFLFPSDFTRVRAARLRRKDVSGRSNG
jgi:hypothetical protein